MIGFTQGERFVRIANVQGRATLVTADGEGVDVKGASAGRFGPGIQSIYDRWAEFTRWAAGTDFAGSAKLSFADVDLESPAPTPRQVFAIGLNYAEHAAEASMTLPPEPAVFTKFVSSITGPFAEVELPAPTVDWEVELVVVIGKEGHQIAKSDAWDHVAGLSVGQDISERTLQHVGTPAQFSLAKSFPGFSPIGPFLVTLDEVPDPKDLEIGCRINGVEMQQGRTTQMVFDVETLIERLSRAVTLYPGDVIFSGTPAGVGAARTPPVYLKAGDKLESYIEGIGEICQVFVDGREV